jgi:streptogramin lyase
MQAPVLTGRQADYCRGKIGLPITRDPKEFDIGKVSLPAPSAYAVAEDGLWFATGDQLQHLDFGLRTNLAVKLPINSDVSITTVVVGAQKIWIATDGDGLIEFDKASHQCRRWTVKDGLMMDVIYCAQLSDGKLWIGYGYRNPPGMVDAVRSGTGGGIGFLDLSSHQFTSFTPSLVGEKDARNSQPPRVAVIAIAAGASGDIWFLADIAHNGPGYVLCRFRSKDNIWERFPQVTAGCCLAADDNQVYVGHFRDFSGRSGGPLGLDTFNFRDRQWKSFKAVEGVPPEVINALALDGHDLWAGGMGYIALVDPDQNQIRKIAHIPTQSMGEIQVGGGYVWAQFNGHLHRVPLSSLQ